MSKQVFILSKSNSNIKSVFDNMTSSTRDMFKKHGHVLITISEKKVSRSIPQNSYLHKLFQLIADATGSRLEDVKDSIKHKTGLIEKKFINGELITVIRSTADLSKKEFSVLIEETIKVCEYLEIKYPKPSFFGYDDFLNES